MSIACQQLVELVTEYLEDTLTPTQLRAVEDHLAGCADCTGYLSQMRQVITLSRGLVDPHPAASALPPGMLDDLLRSFRRQHH
ncbi:MAG: zf-HC2 domain-containing protein [Marmoricola sp.]